MSYEDDFCTCEVCGNKVLYGSMHHQCGTYSLARDAELAKERDKAFEEGVMSVTNIDIPKEVAALLQSNNQLHLKLAMASIENASLKEQNAQLERDVNDQSLELGELRPDAARYRYLRNRDIENDFPRDGLFIGCIPDNAVLSMDDADAAIDAAISAQD